MVFKSNRLILQWHLTERCNLRCTHCYQEAYSGEELRFDDLLRVVKQFKDLLDRLSRGRRKFPVRGHINITGGEPFVRQDFLDLLGVLHAEKERLSFGILTNGTFIDEPMARRLSKLAPSNVQLSIEGNKETNDHIRGTGAYEQTISALKHLIRERIPSVISFTAHRYNFREFANVAHLGLKLGVNRVWADRLIPWGVGSNMREQVLSPEESEEFFEIMYGVQSEGARNFCRTEIAMRRALQFLVGGGRPYHCGAGDRLVTVQPNGDLYPCRRMPIRVGNLMQTPLVELYEESDLFRTLRDGERISEGCEDCSFAEMCRGGLKCLAYALTGDIFKADPGCWRASTNSKPAVVKKAALTGWNAPFAKRHGRSLGRKCFRSLEVNPAFSGI